MTKKLGDNDKVVDLRDKRADAARAALQNARAEAPIRIWKSYKSGPIQIGDGFVEPGKWEPGPDGFLPPWCPVTPLGRDGDVFWYLNVEGGLSCLTVSQQNKAAMNVLFAGAIGFLVHAFPRMSKEGVHTADNYANESAVKALLDAAHYRGSWSPEGKVRGRGAWRADDGSLILHLGDKVLLHGRPYPPGELDGYVYVARAGLPEPVTREGVGDPGAEIFDRLKSWNWRRGETDARLMLGWIGAAMMGGWLAWRPNVFLTGDKAVGKSELQKFVKAVLGDFFVVTHDATAAGLHQYLGHDSVGVGVDEMEADAGSRKTQMVIELARRASSGGRILRGGANHKGHDFIIQSAFLFSAIAPPSMRGQDLSRLTILELKALEAAGEAPNKDVTHLARVGEALLGRLAGWLALDEDAENLTRFEDLMTLFREELRAGGHENRTALQFGTLLAFAWAALCDRMPEMEALTGALNEVQEWCVDLDPDHMVETQGLIETWRQCLNHLLLVTPEPIKNNAASSVMEIINRLRSGLDPMASADADYSFDVKTATAMLAKVGLGLTAPIDPTTNKPIPMSWDNAELFVPNAHPEVGRLFKGTDWEALGGAEGTWKSVLRQMDDDLRYTRRARVGAWRGHGVCIRLAALFGRYFDEDGGN